MAAGGEHGIGTRTLRGVVWAYGSYVGGRLLVLLATAILARLLTPDEFGLVALAITFMALLEGVADLGLSQALVIQREEVTEERADTVFVSSVALGAALAALIAALSPVAASFFEEPELVGIAAALGSNFFLRSLGMTHYALAQKRLDFRARTAAEFADVIVRGATGVGLALAGLGAWSLVIGYLVGTVALVVTIWAFVPWRPRLRLQRAHLREMVGFGGTISAVSVVAAVIANIDYVFVGRVLGVGALGLYTLGFRLPELIVLNFSVVAAQVLFPAFSAVDIASLNRAFRVSLRYTVMLGLPLAVGLAVLAEPFILGLFGDQWRGSIGAMQILTVYAFAVTLGIPAGTAYKATGRAGVLLKLALARLALAAAALAVFVDEGIAAAAACQASVAGLAAIVGIGLALRLLTVSLGDVLGEIWPSFAAAAAMAIPLLAIERSIDSPWPELLAGGAAGTATYVVVLALLAPDSLRYLRRTMFPAAGQAQEALTEEALGQAGPAETLTGTRRTDLVP